MQVSRKFEVEITVQDGVKDQTDILEEALEFAREHLGATGTSYKVLNRK